MDTVVPAPVGSWAMDIDDEVVVALKRLRPDLSDETIRRIVEEVLASSQEDRE